MTSDLSNKLPGNRRYGQQSGGDWRRLGVPVPGRLAPKGITLLVRGDGAFYNPSNTASEAVVPFTCHPGTQLPDGRVAHSANECLNIEIHFCNFQEH